MFGSSGAASAAQQEDEGPQKPFLYDTMEVRAIYEDALRHFEAGRLPEGLAMVQELLERHRGEVLPAASPPVGGRVEGTVHLGAPAWARERLFQLDANGRAAYLRMYGAAAEDALAVALNAPTEANWLRIDRTWPITPAAFRARWASGTSPWRKAACSMVCRPGARPSRANWARTCRWCSKPPLGPKPSPNSTAVRRRARSPRMARRACPACAAECASPWRCYRSSRRRTCTSPTA
ncbi:MAG: hypothetical protein R3E96_12050 [Planctomycetota bacterium]